MKFKRFFALFLACITLVLALTSCAAGSGSSNGYTTDSLSPINTAPGPSFSENYVDSSSPDVLSDRKLVKTIGLTCETKDYDAFNIMLTERVAELGGYIENFSENQSRRFSSRLYYSDYRNEYYDDWDAGYYAYRYANATVRVPVEKLDTFLNNIEGTVNITARTSRVDDITLSYIDVESYVTALTLEQTRLLELMETADNLTDIIALESRLSEVRRQIESYTSQLKLMDNQVDYATVHLDISEVMDFTDIDTLPTGYFGRLWLSFKRGCANTWDGLIELSFWVAENIVAMLVWIAIIYFVVKALRKAWRKRRARRDAIRNRAKPSGDEIKGEAAAGSQDAVSDMSGTDEVKK